MLRSWGPRADIPAVNQKAREAAAQLLAQLAILRLDSKQVSCLGNIQDCGKRVLRTSVLLDLRDLCKTPAMPTPIAQYGVCSTHCEAVTGSGMHIWAGMCLLVC
jgi:hypothetical protein